MGNKFNLEVVTPDHMFFEGETDMVILRTTEGDIGILYDHEPLVAPLRIGSMRVRQDDNTFLLAACSAGFLTVNDDKVTVVVDSAEWVTDINLERALEAKARAEKRITESKDKDIDFIRAKASLERAINRIKLRDVYK